MTQEAVNEALAEMRADQRRALFQRYWGVIVLAVVVVLAAIGGWQWSVYRSAQRAERAASTYFTTLAALKAPDMAPDVRERVQAQSVLRLQKLTQSAPGVLRALAAFELAQLQLNKGQDVAARATLKDVATNTQQNPLLRQVAQFAQLNLARDPSIDTNVRRQYQEMGDHDGPWRAMAQERLAALDLLPGASVVQREEAQRILKELAQSFDAPTGVRERAQALLTTFHEGE